MATVDLGILRVLFRGDSTQLDSEGKKVENIVNRTDRETSASTERMGVSWRRLAATVGISSGIIVASLRSAVDSMIAVRNASIATGESVESLQRMEFAAKSVGATFADVEAATKSYQQALRDFARNDVSDATRAITELGLTLRDGQGNFRTFSDLLPDIANKFAGMADGVKKAELAQALLGDGWQRLLPLFNQGSAGLARLNKEAQDSGFVKSAEDLKRYQKALFDLNNEWNAFIVTLTGPVTTALSAINPVLKLFGDLFAEATREARKFDLKRDFEAAAREVENYQHKIEDAREALERLTMIPSRKKGGDDDEIEHQKALIDEYSKALEAAKSKRDALGAQMNPIFGPPVPTSISPPAMDAFKSAADAAKKALDEIQDRLQGLPVLMSQAFVLDPRGFQEGYDAIIRAQAAGVLSAQQATKMKLQLQRQEQAEILNTASLVASTLTAVFGKSKLAAIGSAVINTAVGITKALSGSVPPFNFINAALVAAAGAAQIAAIRSTTETGGGGAAAPVGGGSAGGGGETSEASTPAPRTLFIEGVNRSGQFSVQAVRDLIGQINEEVRNGAILVVG
jgi:hypothetical protein